jgi:hypothetical protein
MTWRLALTDPAHSHRIREGLAAAKARGATLGGLRPGTRDSNIQSHARAVEDARAWRWVFDACQGKSLRETRRALAEAGCMTASGKPLSAEQVRVMRRRLLEDPPSVDVTGTPTVGGMDPVLRSFLALIIAIDDRDEEAVLQGLSDASERFAESDVLWIVSSLREGSDLPALGWLRKLARL